MSVQMNIAEAKAKLSELLARAEAGEEVVIARDGTPAVVLAPAKAAESALGRPTRREIGFFSHLGEVRAGPDTWAPDTEAADFAEQSFEEDFAAPEPTRKSP